MPSYTFDPTQMNPPRSPQFRLALLEGDRVLVELVSGLNEVTAEALQQLVAHEVWQRLLQANVVRAS